MSFDLEMWCDEHLDGRRKGDEYPAICPWCDEPKKFSVNIEKNVFRCYRDSCPSNEVPRWVGYLLAHVEGITPGEARAKINEGSIELPKEPAHRRVKPSESASFDIDLPPEFIPCYKPGRVMDGEPKEWRVIKYLKDRVSRETLKKYGVGFAYEGKYYNRAILPIRCAGVNAWTGRDATDEHKESKFRPKYTNPPGEWADAAFFGWDEADTTGADLVLAEGPFDVMRLSDHGINAIGLLGKELKEGQRGLLFSLPYGTVLTLMLDPEVKRYHIDDLVARIPRRLRVYIATLDPEPQTEDQKRDGVDPGNSTREQAEDAIEDARPAR